VKEKLGFVFLPLDKVHEDAMQESRKWMQEMTEQIIRRQAESIELAITTGVGITNPYGQ
jgi:hypothetical protein